MPYIFALTLVLNLAALGYFMFFHEGISGQSPQVAQAKSSIANKVSVSKTSE